MTRESDRPLYLLAFDHRASFSKGLFGITGRPQEEQKRRISLAKRIIFEGARRALAEGSIPGGAAGILVDEEFGAQIARDARRQGLVLAMPVEKSGQPEFELEFGDAFGAHVEDFDPDYVKVLVRYNPEGDRAMNVRQASRLASLSQWLKQRQRKFLFELLIPAEPSQLALVGGKADRYDREVRPRLLLQTIRELNASGVEPEVWRIEGLDARAECRAAVAAAREGGRSDVSCIVLGRGADDKRVEAWLQAGAGVPGYRGFAIGRTFWWDALVAWRDGMADEAEAAKRIAAKYCHMVRVYERASASGMGPSKQL